MNHRKVRVEDTLAWQIGHILGEIFVTLMFVGVYFFLAWMYNTVWDKPAEFRSPVYEISIVFGLVHGIFVNILQSMRLNKRLNAQS